MTPLGPVAIDMPFTTSPCPPSTTTNPRSLPTCVFPLQQVVYSKNICTQEHLIRWHYLMAKYFGQLPPCDRKLEVFPYHLEMAGSWSKVKNCLTDIEMFDLWWTPKFKSDFIKFWASLTRQTPTIKEEYGESVSDTYSDTPIYHIPYQQHTP